MLGSPPDMETAKVMDHVRQIDGVADVHHAHLWQMDEHMAALDTHLVIDKGDWHRADAIKAVVKAALQERFGIIHSTIEMECAAHACTDAAAIGH